MIDMVDSQRNESKWLIKQQKLECKVITNFNSSEGTWQIMTISASTEFRYSKRTLVRTKPEQVVIHLQACITKTPSTTGPAQITVCQPYLHVYFLLIQGIYPSKSNEIRYSQGLGYMYEDLVKA